MSRTVVWVSAGAASAVAAKVALAQGPTTLAYTDPGSEHPDNKRFLDDLEQWYGQEIIRLRSDRYRDVDDVIESTGYIVGNRGARCTTELKKRLRLAFQRPDDRQVFGYTHGEQDRAKLAEENDPGIDWWWPLIEAGLTKEDCLAIVDRAGIELPWMYLHGYGHNNCIGCVKANNFTYWNMIREDFPDVFERRAGQERTVGHSKRLLDLGLSANVGTEKQPRYTVTEQGKQSIGCHGANEVPLGATERLAPVPTGATLFRGGTGGTSTDTATENSGVIDGP